MPKLPREARERNRHAIEAAALGRFTRQGFHGTTMRDIANAARVSIGNIYNYYHTKLDLFESLVRRYQERFDSARENIFAQIQDPFGRRDLHRLALLVRRVVYENPDYWRLMYIDVVEFENRHFARTFDNLAGRFARRFPRAFRRAARDPQWTGVDPALAFTAIYLQLFTHFLVEKLFHGRQHLGRDQGAAMSQLVELFTRGLWQPDQRKTPWLRSARSPQRRRGT